MLASSVHVTSSGARIENGRWGRRWKGGGERCEPVLVSVHYAGEEVVDVGARAYREEDDEEEGLELEEGRLYWISHVSKDASLGGKAFSYHCNDTSFMYSIFGGLGEVGEGGGQKVVVFDGAAVGCPSVGSGSFQVAMALRSRYMHT